MKKRSSTGGGGGTLELHFEVLPDQAEPELGQTARGLLVQQTGGWGLADTTKQLREQNGTGKGTLRVALTPRLPRRAASTPVPLAMPFITSTSGDRAGVSTYGGGCVGYVEETIDDTTHRCHPPRPVPPLRRPTAHRRPSPR